MSPEAMSALAVSLLIARLALAAIFAAAALGKLADRAAFAAAVERFGLPRRIAGPLGLLLPLAELAIAASLLPVATARWAALAAAAVLAAFCAAIVRVVARGEVVDCNCFGSLGSGAVGRGTLVRNGVLVAVAGFVAIASWNDGGASAFAWIGGHVALAAVAGAIAAVTLLHMAFSWQLFKQNSRLLDRVSDLEAALGSRDDSESGGLPVGEPAPGFALPDLDGRTVTLDDLLAVGGGALLVFTDPACTHCNPLLPALGRAQAAVDGMPVAVISTGADRDNRAQAEEHGIAQLLLQDRFEVAESYRVYGAPIAVLVDAAGRIAAEPAGGAKAIAALLDAAATTWPALAR